MAILAPTHTSQFVIRPRALRRQRLWLLAVLVLLVAVPYLSYETGRARAGYSVINSLNARREQAAQIAVLERQIARLQRDLRSAQFAQQSSAQTASTEQQVVAALQAQLRKQQQDLAFYKAIVAPAADAPNAPRVQRVEVEALPVAQHYRLRLMLIQTMNASSQAQGDVQVTLSGVQGGRSVTLNVLDVLTEPEPSALRFAYRHFHTLEPVIRLPEDFTPATVHTEVRAAQHDAMRQSFAWPKST